MNDIICEHCGGTGVVGHPKTGWQLIPQNIIDKISEWKEKAEKYDEIHIEYERLKDGSVYLEYREKARKWDEWRKLPSTVTMEKARKWDEVKEFVHDGIRYPKHVADEWQEKAKKWDEYKDLVIKYGRVESLKELEEKARKYDENARLITLFGWIEDTKTLTEIQEKARKYDELLFHHPAANDGHLTLVNTARLQELEEKTAKWDKVKKLLRD